MSEEPHLIPFDVGDGTPEQLPPGWTEKMYGDAIAGADTLLCITLLGFDDADCEHAALPTLIAQTTGALFSAFAEAMGDDFAALLLDNALAGVKARAARRAIQREPQIERLITALRTRLIAGADQQVAMIEATGSKPS